MQVAREYRVLGKRLRVLRYDNLRDVAWVYGWRDVVAFPVTLTWLEAAPK